jgi:putative transposase
MSKRVVTPSLHPSPDQAAALEATMRAFNAACPYSSDVAWEQQQFGRVDLHHLMYRSVRKRFGLPSQLAVLAIGIVTDSYKPESLPSHPLRAPPFSPTAG